MKVRVLWVPPHERALKSGKVYDLADGQHLVDAGEAETVGDDVEAEADPRPPIETAVEQLVDAAGQAAVATGVLVHEGRKLFGAAAAAVRRRLSRQG